ncbi:MAG TPA: S53 family peptidase [Tepidisphaeraceae bacterium]|nr:S53 family peptidase [Tepidisphaeraceae bacterium]
MVFARGKDRMNRRSGARRSLIEALETRQLLSASASSITLHSDAEFMRPSATSTTSVDGYSPAQIRAAYRFDDVSLGNGATADGSGQTIAIVDAFNDPKIPADLGVFDSQFGLSAPPSFKVVNQNGGTTLPTTDAGWSGEIALDVEWAHAIAPGANILLVEATSDSLTDLMSAVDYARNADGVSVVSMSWGGSEFFGFNGSEFTGQTQYDPFFTTPTGHQGVTFVAAAGDSGVVNGVQWPASSPNVLSVGGTSLYVQDSNGTYGTETSWAGTSGGYSQVESQPSYQFNVPGNGARSTPDVSYDGDPNTGFAVYDSVAYQGYSGWQVVGGTSAGAPQWAALVAVADQGRAAAGQGSLDGISQTLPALYSVYPTSSSPDVSAYENSYNDVIDHTSGGRFHWRFGGFGFSNPATPGYDVATGLGTPKADAIVSALVNVSGSGDTGGSGTGDGGGGSGSTGTTPQQLPASQLAGVFATSRIAPVIGGTAGVDRVRVTNDASTAFEGPISIVLYASTTASTSSSSLATDKVIATTTVPAVNIAAGKSQVVPVKFTYPTDLADAAYFLIAAIDEVGLNVAPAVATTNTPLLIKQPRVDLAATFAATQVQVNEGKNGFAVVRITNKGNVAANGAINLTLYASAADTLDPSTATAVGNLTGRAIHLAAGHSIRLLVKFAAPSDLSPGSYSLFASLTSSTQPADTNTANDVAQAGTK